MAKRFGTATLTVGIAAGALAGVAVGAPLLASAAGTSPSTTPSASASAPATPGADRTAQREARIKDALKSLVDDGTITQEQADKVAAKLAATLPGRDGWRGGKDGFRGGMLDLARDGLDTAAKALGMTPDQVRQGLESGKSLADLAKEKGVATATVVDALVAEANTRIDQAVKDGRFDAARATELKSRAKEMVTAFVNGDLPKFGGHGFGGPGGFGGRPDAAPSPSSTA